MPQILYTVEEYIAEHRKKDSIWIVFNTRYNEIHALHQKLDDDNMVFYDEQYTDSVAREAFLAYMKEHFPDTTLVNVFDLVSPDWLGWPYLGSIAIDADIGSDVYNALCAKYGDAYEDPNDTNQALWVMEYQDAIVCHKRRCDSMDAEFGEDD